MNAWTLVSWTILQRLAFPKLATPWQTSSKTLYQMIHNIPQPEFEEFIYQKLQVDPNTEVSKGVAFVSCEQASVLSVILHLYVVDRPQTPNTVTTTVEERSTGRRYILRSRHLIACDGARSQVRKVLKVASEGEETCKWRLTRSRGLQFLLTPS